MEPRAWIHFIQFQFCSPQLHQHLHLHSIRHLNNKTYALSADLQWQQYLHLCILYQLLDLHNLYKKCLHHSVHATLYTTTFSVYPLPTTSTRYWIITNTSTTYTTWPSYSLLPYLLPFLTLVLFIFTLTPLFSMKSFHSLSVLIRSSSVAAITTRSSAYNNSHGKATLNSLDKACMTITNSKGLNAEPWCIPTFTSEPLHHNCHCHLNFDSIDWCSVTFLVPTHQPPVCFLLNRHLSQEQARIR